MLSPDTLVTLQRAISYLAIALLVFAAYSDIRTFRIPNLLVLAIAVLGVIHLVLLGGPISAIYAVGASVLFFVIGLFLFSRGIVGGGDVKLLAATVLLIRYPDLFKFFVRMSVFGALLSIAVLATRNYIPLFVGPRLAARMATIRRAVPYGVAISAAGIVTLLFQPLLFGYSTFLGSSFLRW